MATEVVMPRLSDTMDAGTIAKWLKHEGDRVKRGDILAEIETDKANMDMEAFSDGILAQILVGEGQSANLGQPIALLAASEEEAQSLKGGQKPEPETETPTAAPGAVERERRPRVPETPVGTSSAGPSASSAGPPVPAAGAETEAQESQLSAQGSSEDGRIKASPLARRLAQEHGVELAEIGGTGPGGRITKEDVQSFLRRAGPPPEVGVTAGVPETPAPSTDRQAEHAPAGEGIRAAQPVEMNRMRQTIARRLTEARFSAPDFLLTAEFDLTEARSLLKSIAGVEGAPKVGPNDLLVKAVATSLRHHPDANAGWENDGVVRYGRINVGIAVATPGGGLVVPVIQDSDRKSLGEISTEAKDLIQKARSNKLAPAEREGGTFTISNLGMFGIDQFTSILNPPEACSLAVGAITPKAVVVDGEIVIRDRMRVTLTCDHRVINGAEGAEFLQTLRRYLEQPLLLVL